MKRIICIGNRYIPQDSAGPRVYDRLQRFTLPHNVEVIDGGLSGLNLLRAVEGAERVVFIDSINGNCQPRGFVILKPSEVGAQAENGPHHAAGLPYLLRILPAVCDGPLPCIVVLGVAQLAGEGTLDRVATQAVKMVAADANPADRF